jgi:hypothetical protein
MFFGSVAIHAFQISSVDSHMHINITLFPPPPKKWQVPQLDFVGRPTFCATRERSTFGSGIPAPEDLFTYVSLLS